MKSRIALLLVMALFSCVIAPVPLRAQSPQDKPNQDDSVVLRANEVVLDMVVRDKKGHAIKDLKQGDIEVLEDNVRQDITSFRLVSREAVPVTKDEPKAATTAPATPSGPRDPFSNISLVAMAFDHLSPNGRTLAQKAAQSFIAESLQPDDQVSVCVIDQSLRVVQQYTNDVPKLKQAVDRATEMAVSGIESQSSDRRNVEERANAASDQAGAAASAAAAGGGSGPAVGSASAEQALLNMQVREMQTFETLERNQQGQAQINSLLAIINSMRDVPGRKAIVMFSEGLALPPDVKVRFDAVVNAATRAKVSVYTVEAGGLRTESGNAEAAREIKSMGESRTRALSSGREDRSGRPMTMQLERGEDILRLNPQSGLGELASSTGGFMIADTNDLAGGLRRIDEDLRTHYEISYVSKNTNLDGKFRQITIKPSRSGLEIQTRKGYLALPPTGSSPVLEYEAPAVAAMYKATGNNAFPLKAMAFNFPESQRAGFITVLAEVPANVFTYTPSADKKTFTTDYSIVAIIKNDAQQVVGKLSKHYATSGQIELMEEAKKGDVLFYKEDRLPPGQYTMELAAYDAPSGKVSVRTMPFEVLPSDNSRLRMSSLIVMKRGEKLSASEQQQDKDAKQANPFHYGGELLIYPNLGEPVSKAAMNQQFSFFVDVYVPQGSATTPKMTIEIYKGGQVAARMQPDLPAPDATGRIQYANVLSMAKVATGNYELKVTVNDGTGSVSRRIPFTIAP